jgi:hypothetical protein
VAQRLEPTRLTSSVSQRAAGRHRRARRGKRVAVWVAVASQWGVVRPGPPTSTGLGFGGYYATIGGVRTQKGRSMCWWALAGSGRLARLGAAVVRVAGLGR